MTPLLPEAHPRIAETKADLAMVLRNDGRPELAIPLYLEATAALQKSRGPFHPSVGIVIGNYGGMLAELGRHSQAELAHRQALEIHRRSFGKKHARVALALNALGFSLQHQQRVEEAEHAFRDALDALPETHASWVSAFRQNLGNALLRLNRPVEALAEFDEAKATADKTKIIDLAVLERRRAEALHQAGRADLAEAAAGESIGLLLQRQNEGAELANAHHVRGSALASLGRTQEAIVELETALAMYEGSRGEQPPWMESARIEIARLRKLPTD